MMYRNKQFLLLVLQWMLLYKLLKRKKKQIRWYKRRWYVRPINQLRYKYGDYETLYQELKNDTYLFFCYTRMNLCLFNKLLQLTEPHLTKNSYRAFPAEQRLIIVLRYLATGDLPLSIALSFRIGESTMRMLIKEVCQILINVLQPLYLSQPNEEEWKSYAEGFWKRWNVPNCIGAVDGKHITLQCPPNSGSLFYNYKKYYSIVLMAVANHVYRFTLVDVGAYGGNSDGGIFNDSLIGENLKNENLNLPKETFKLPGSQICTPTFLLADDAFALNTRIMKPYTGRNLNEEQKICNYRFSRARRTVESAFGIFSNRWRIFRQSICMLPKTADLITTASLCLHNFVMVEEERCKLKLYSTTEFLENDRNNQDMQWLSFSENLCYNEPVSSASKQRDTLCKYFISPEGEVPWQYDYVRRGTYGENI
ncbi:protein ANTAGONIST OF LIKE HETEROCHROMATIN PROTEIN 1-like isoform X2 [Nylanderia fulva]|nr:protein ANTAGONIST OF LIKE HETEROCHROMATIN PROTEIN 1-like isoform X2 [Nylanderia fulva]